MASHTLTLDLFAPGMTSTHRAGIGGLPTTLMAFERAGTSVEGISWELQDTSITLRCDEPQAVVRLVETAMYCEDGLITFAAFTDIAAYARLETRLRMNEGLLDTLLQHNKALRPGGAKKSQTIIEIDGQPQSFTVKQLTDFQHRFDANQLVDARHGGFASSIPVKGWALPGAIVRHEAAKVTTVREPPGRHLALIFAIVGCVIVRLLSPRDRKKYKSVVLMPDVDDLRLFARARRQLVRSSHRLIASGPGDAALLFFAELEAANLLDSLRVRGCHAVAMGTVTWAEKQKTRTRILNVERPSVRVLTVMAAVERYFPVRYVESRKRRDNAWFPTLPLWRQLFTDNLVAGRPLWAGLGTWLADAERRKQLVSFERNQVTAMIRDLKNQGILGRDPQILFVEACHQALRGRYARLNRRIEEERLDRTRAFEREKEQIRASLHRCKNQATLRSAVVDLWARGGSNTVLRDEWRQILVFLSTEPWELARDLALLALISYPGTERPDTQSPRVESPSTESATTSMEETA